MKIGMGISYNFVVLVVDRYSLYVKPVLIGHTCANDIRDCDLRGNEFKISYDPVLDVIVEKPSIYLYHADKNGINLHNFSPK
ncbi:MAG: hypothetical protein QW815_09545 [Nitrososphaerota archaeon]